MPNETFSLRASIPVCRAAGTIVEAARIAQLPGFSRYLRPAGATLLNANLPKTTHAHAARFRFDSSHYLNHHSNLPRIIDELAEGSSGQPTRESGQEQGVDRGLLWLVLKFSTVPWHRSAKGRHRGTCCSSSA